MKGCQENDDQNPRAHLHLPPPSFHLTTRAQAACKRQYTPRSGLVSSHTVVAWTLNDPSGSGISASPPSSARCCSSTSLDISKPSSASTSPRSFPSLSFNASSF